MRMVYAEGKRTHAAHRRERSRRRARGTRITAQSSDDHLVRVDNLLLYLDVGTFQRVSRYK